MAPTILVNSANPFIKLLLTTIQSKDKQVRSLSYRLFKELIYSLESRKFFLLQNRILDSLVEKKIISEIDTLMYTFKSEDLAI